MNSIKVSSKKLLFIAMGLFSLGQSFAQSQSLPLSVTGDDPYLPTETLPSGPHRGDSIPVEFRRSIQILSRDQANNTVTVANFAHHDSYYLAKIPLSGIEKIYFQIDYFTGSIPAAHSEIRLKFKAGSPILLFPQLKSKAASGAVAIQEAVFSIEAVKSESTALSFMKGFGKNYAVAYRFISLQQKHRDLVETEKEHVTQYELNLTHSEKEKILTQAIETSDLMGVKYFYNTWKRNCTTELIRILDRSVPSSIWRLALRPVTTIGTHYPVFVRSSLRARGLLGEEIAVFDQDQTLDLTETPRNDLSLSSFL